MSNLLMRVNTAVVVPVNILPLLDDTDFKTIESAVAFNAAGLALRWNFVTPAGVVTSTAVTPTNTGGVYDWSNLGGGMYAIEIPASGGGSINNNAVGYGWFSGVATGVLPWRGPVIQFGIANVVNALAVGDEFLEVAATRPDWSISGATLTVLKRDESSTQYTKTLGSTPGADPITSAT